jgi:hypothetical protein
LSPFFQRIGIEHHVSCPHAHQQNGYAERKHRHIVEVGLTLLTPASMPLKSIAPINGFVGTARLGTICTGGSIQKRERSYLDC